MKNIGYLKENGLHLENFIEVSWPGDLYADERLTLDLSIFKNEFDGCYTIKYSTICFVDKREVYVIPETSEARSIIENSGLVFKDFDMPFDRVECIPALKIKWIHLKEKAIKAKMCDYEKDCREWCRTNGIGELDDKVLNLCLKIPPEGIRVKGLFFEMTITPVCNELELDQNVMNRLGKYCTKLGNIVFINNDGHTYVGKESKVLNKLKKAGYNMVGIFVPFTNGEKILDKKIREQWERLSSD